MFSSSLCLSKSIKIGVPLQQYVILFFFVKFIPALLKSFKNLLPKIPLLSGIFTKIEVLSFPLGLFSKSLKIKNLVLLLFFYLLYFQIRLKIIQF